MSEFSEHIKATIELLEERAVVDDNAVRHLSALFVTISGEARYDPENEATQRFAARLLPHIEALNAKFHFHN
jgi:hypothetical protein